MRVENWFPVSLLYHDFDSNTVESVKNIITDDFKQTYLNFIPSENLSTSYYKEKNILNNIQLSFLKDAILNVAAQYANEIGFGRFKKLSVKFSWLNVFKKGNHETAHNHYGNFISGVYYVKSDENSSSFYFEDHIETRKMWSEQYSDCRHNSHPYVSYKPKEGRVLLFPSWLIHGVQPNEKETERISLAFNIDVDR